MMKNDQESLLRKSYEASKVKIDKFALMPTIRVGIESEDEGDSSHRNGTQGTRSTKRLPAESQTSKIDGKLKAICFWDLKETNNWIPEVRE